MENLNLVLPEIFISLSIMFLLVLGVFKKDSSKLIFNISLLVLLITATIILNETSNVNRTTLFNNSVVIDYMSSLMKIITLVGAFLVLVISPTYLKIFKIFKIEYPILILMGVFKDNFLVAVVASFGVILGAAYMLWLYKRVVFGKLINKDLTKMVDLNKSEYFILTCLAVPTLFFGFYPDPLINTIEVSVNDLINMYNANLINK